MNYYETLYIVHPSLESGRLKDIILSVEESLKKIGGSPLAMELWGKRKLAYFIDKQRYGTYVLLHYNGEGKCTGEFAVELEQNPNILAYLTTSIEKENVLEQAEDLDTQIAGKTRESQRTESSSEPTKTTETEPTEVTTQENDTIDATADEVTSEGGDEQLDLETETKEADTSEVENEEESVEVGEAKADEEPLEATENESDKKDTADDEVSPEEDIESKQENADETAAVSEEE
ncbi:MAG TPA: 30S ribosomal protein S6, partial [Candidatus Marinimicrobia bacterium]|jgi:small subunit ribosomal protein S6|nr:30S ribosomal protein S6 [Candidatus Neomarinimicrobiota bacterium]